MATSLLFGFFLLAVCAVSGQNPPNPDDPTFVDCYECSYSQSLGSDMLCVDGDNIPNNSTYVKESTPLNECEVCIRTTKYDENNALVQLVRSCGLGILWDDFGDIPKPGCVKQNLREGYTETCYCATQLCNAASRFTIHNALALTVLVIVMAKIF